MARCSVVTKRLLMIRKPSKELETRQKTLNQYKNPCCASHFSAVRSSCHRTQEEVDRVELEKVQTRATKRSRGMERLSYKERRKWLGDMREIYEVLSGVEKVAGYPYLLCLIVEDEQAAGFKQAKGTTLSPMHN